MNRSLAAALFSLVVLAGCSSDSTAADASTAPAPSSTAVAPTTSADTATTSTAGEPDTSTADTEPVAPQSVTASTVHETRTDDFPDILAAEAVPADDGSWQFNVTVSSPYDSPERYADAWRVVSEDGTELGIRVLTHDHANEQPFTRSESGIVIPSDVTTVRVEGRDLANGWGGGTLTVDLTAGQ